VSTRSGEASIVIFSLEHAYYDSTAEADAGKEIVLATPQLGVYFTQEMAIDKNEGLNIVEGDLSFFASDGSPMKANFSREPFIDSDRRTYFPGVYTLEAGAGKPLQETIAGRIENNPSPHTKIIVRMPEDDEHARFYGWSSLSAMKKGVADALQILPLSMLERVVYE
jgi:hypothetical protein